MRTKSLVIAAILSMVLAGCDRIVHLPDERFLPMVNEVSAAYDMAFQADNLDTIDKAILIFYSPGTSSDAAIPYTEVWVDSVAKLSEVYGNLLLFSTDNEKTTVLFYHGPSNDRDIAFYKVSDNIMYLKQYDATVPVGNIVERDDVAKELRRIIFAPRWYTFGSGSSLFPNDTDRINELEKRISENFSLIMEEVSKHIDFHSEGSPGE